jgi:hypothetical protein
MVRHLRVVLRGKGPLAAASSLAEQREERDPVLHRDRDPLALAHSPRLPSEQGGRVNTFKISAGLVVIFALQGCANFLGNPGRTRLSDEYSYYEPFDNSSDAGSFYEQARVRVPKITKFLSHPESLTLP